MESISISDNAGKAPSPAQATRDTRIQPPSSGLSDPWLKALPGKLAKLGLDRVDLPDPKTPGLRIRASTRKIVFLTRQRWQGSLRPFVLGDYGEGPAQLTL